MFSMCAQECWAKLGSVIEIVRLRFHCGRSIESDNALNLMKNLIPFCLSFSSSYYFCQQVACDVALYLVSLRWHPNPKHISCVSTNHIQWMNSQSEKIRRKQQIFILFEYEIIGCCIFLSICRFNEHLKLKKKNIWRWVYYVWGGWE